MKSLSIDTASDFLLTVIIPVYNEASTIDRLLSHVLTVPYPKQVVIVDDGSSDNTAALLARWTDNPEVMLLHHPINRGKGAAIRTGLAHARGRFTLVQDADLEYDPCDYPRLLEPLLQEQAVIVYGSRYLQPPPDSHPSWRLFRYGVALLNLAVRVLYGVRLTDEATCYKIFPTDVLRAMNLQCERFEFCPEVTAKACRMGLTIAEVPIRYTPRAAADGKKIRWTDGWEALVTLWKWRHWQPVVNAIPPLQSKGEFPGSATRRWRLHTTWQGWHIHHPRRAITAKLPNLRREMTRGVSRAWNMVNYGRSCPGRPWGGITAMGSKKKSPSTDTPETQPKRLPGNRAIRPGRCKPRFNKEERQFWVGTQLVKWFRQPAVSQETVLSAFQELSWPSIMDDPLPHVPGVDPKHRLHDTINSLNRRQIRRLLHFSAMGNGTRIGWRLLGRAPLELHQGRS
jgi:dolichol-phosphate mannosyltransferase